MNKVKSYLQTGYRYIKDQRAQIGQPVQFYNWIGETRGSWFERFIYSRKIPCSKKGTIAFFSVFGEQFPMLIDRSRIKVFFTGENLHRNEFGFSYQDYADYLSNKHLDLSLGFDYLKDDSYLRFPLWILYLIDPEDTSVAAIRRLCEKLSNHLPDDIFSRRFCSLVSGHDPNGLRRVMHDTLAEIGKINCGGRYLNNTSELKQVYNNNKHLYMEQFKFNICPENSNAPGYVTEKLFEAVLSGTIPFYWGSDNNPEPEILNHDAIIFWNKDSDNTENVELIRSLNQNSQLYKDFYTQPRLKPDAAEYLSEMLWGLEMKLRKLITSTI